MLNSNQCLLHAKKLCYVAFLPETAAKFRIVSCYTVGCIANSATTTTTTTILFDAANSSAGQEISLMLRKPNVRYRVQNSPPSVF